MQRRSGWKPRAQKATALRGSTNKGASAKRTRGRDRQGQGGARKPESNNSSKPRPVVKFGARRKKQGASVPQTQPTRAPRPISPRNPALENEQSGEMKMEDYERILSYLKGGGKMPDDVIDEKYLDDYSRGPELAKPDMDAYLDDELLRQYEREHPDIPDTYIPPKYDRQDSVVSRQSERELEINRFVDSRMSDEYSPFGRPGAGAPLRDPSGRLITSRSPRKVQALLAGQRQKQPPGGSTTLSLGHSERPAASRQSTFTFGAAETPAQAKRRKQLEQRAALDIQLQQKNAGAAPARTSHVATGDLNSRDRRDRRMRANDSSLNVGNTGLIGDGGSDSSRKLTQQQRYAQNLARQIAEKKEREELERLRQEQADLADEERVRREMKELAVREGFDSASSYYASEPATQRSSLSNVNTAQQNKRNNLGSNIFGGGQGQRHVPDRARKAQQNRDLVRQMAEQRAREERLKQQRRQAPVSPARSPNHLRAASPPRQRAVSPHTSPRMPAHSSPRPSTLHGEPQHAKPPPSRASTVASVNEEQIAELKSMIDLLINEQRDLKTHISKQQEREVEREKELARLRAAVEAKSKQSSQDKTRTRRREPAKPVKAAGRRASKKAGARGGPKPRKARAAPPPVDSKWSRMSSGRPAATHKEDPEEFEDEEVRLPSRPRAGSRARARAGRVKTPPQHDTLYHDTHEERDDRNDQDGQDSPPYSSRYRTTSQLSGTVELTSDTSFVYPGQEDEVAMFTQDEVNRLVSQVSGHPTSSVQNHNRPKRFRQPKVANNFPW